ncbi:MAG TPA: hypothetical protein VLZ05_14660 [Mycobacterium sp.]|nr:hypothetical protein [Mycobacterium sp.]HUH69980.1 hypothetical protein [Mycobacterium sp.]
MGTEHVALQRISPTVLGEVRAWHAPPAYRFPTAAASHPDIWQAWHDANDAN